MTSEQNTYLFVLAATAIIALAAFLSLAVTAVTKSRKSLIERCEDKRTKETALNILDSADEAVLLTEVIMMFLGIVAGLMAASFGAPILAKYLDFLPQSYFISLILNVAGTTFILMLFGVFIPKKMADTNPEKYLFRYQNILRALLFIASPIITLLSKLAKNTLLLFGVSTDFEETVTEDEVKDLIEQGTEDGTIEKAEQDLVESIFYLGDQTAYTLMTPRLEMLWLDLEDNDKINLQKIEENPLAVFATGRGSLDEEPGFIYSRELLSATLKKNPVRLRDFIKKPMTIPRSMEALRIMEKFRDSGVHEALVIDEYGGVVGFITLNDILLKLIGEDSPHEEKKAFPITKQGENSWSLEGLCPIDEFKEEFDLKTLPKEDRGHFQTMGGFVTALFGYIPKRGEKISWENFSFEVLSMDRARVKKILVVMA
ncbi:MAG: HlyC/CorC family transporter [Selenomonadaceae bacterium]|nr:HlyC/CorC family transporter [Selenomonadaceae bacterium]